MAPSLLDLVVRRPGVHDLTEPERATHAGTKTAPSPPVEASAGPSGARVTNGPNGRAFAHLLVSTMFALVVNYTVWFALTFWVFLRTGSVFATGVIAGLFAIVSVVTGVWFGAIVDHRRKKRVMQASAGASLLLYAAALTIYLITPASTWKAARCGGSSSPRSWRAHPRAASPRSP